MVGAGKSVFKGEADFFSLIIKCSIEQRMRLFSILINAFNSILSTESDEIEKKNVAIVNAWIRQLITLY